MIPDALKSASLRELKTIPGIGNSIAKDLWTIGIRHVSDLRNRDPEELYSASNRVAGTKQDRCLLHTFRAAVYFAETAPEIQDPEKLKWWIWKDSK